MAELNIDQELRFLVNYCDARDILQHSINGIACCKMVYRAGMPYDWVYLWTNSAFQTQSGLTSVVGKLASELIPGLRESDPTLIETFGRVAAGGAPEKFEIFVEGLKRWLKVQAYSPKPEHFVAIFDDITESKQHEFELKQVLERLALAQRASHSGVWDWNLVTDQVTWSEEIFHLFGFDPATTESNFATWRSCLHPDDLKDAEEKLGSAIRDKTPLFNEYRIILPTGDERWIAAYGDIIHDLSGQALRLVGICINVTEKKRTEIAAFEAKSKLQAALENMSDAVFISDSSGRLIEFNEAFATFHKFKNKDECAKTLYEYPAFLDVVSSSGELLPVEQWAVPRALRGESAKEAEFTLHRKDTGETWIGSYNFAPIRGVGGDIVGSVVTCRDITERVLAEDDLRKKTDAMRTAAEYTRSLIEVSQDPLVTISASGKITDVNVATERATGVARDKLIDTDFADYFTDPLLAREIYLRAFAQGFVTDYPLAIRHASGIIIEVFYNANTYRDKAGKVLGVFASAHDISERIRMERDLKNSQRRLERSEAIAHVGHWSYNVADQSFVWSDELWNIYGRKPHSVELTYDTFISWAREDFRAYNHEKLRQMLLLKPGETVKDYLFCLVRPDGEQRWAEVFLEAEFDQGCTPVRFFGVVHDVTERKNADEDLRLSNASFSTIFFQAPLGIALIDSHTREICELNYRFAEIAGRTVEEMTHIDWMSITHPDDVQEDLDNMALLNAGKIPGFTMDKRYLRPDGSAVWIKMTIAPLISEYYVTPRHLCMIDDITGRKWADQKLHLAASVFTHASEGIMITDGCGNIVDVNAAFTRITSYSRAEVLGQNPRIFSSGRHDKEFCATMWRDFSDQGYWCGEVWNRRKNGEVYPVMQNISVLRDAKGGITQYVALLTDITATKEKEIALDHIAHYDTLTNLPNRALLADRLQQAMVRAERSLQPLAVIFLDLDGFKAINDSHGHGVGDQLLIALANRMKQALREGDTLSRSGGDEFVAILPDLGSTNDCDPTLSRLLAAAAEPVHIGYLLLQVSASIGVTFYPQDEEMDGDQLLRQADQSMYQAKLAGKNRYHVFDAAQGHSVRGFHDRVERIRQALNDREFVLYYQPKVNMRTGAVIGAEALIRWQHPEEGLLLPATFLPVIENHPLAAEIGEWVIESALTQIEIWKAAGLSIPVSVNIGSRQLQQVNFVDRLRALLCAHTDVKPFELSIEMLETSALQNLIRASHVIDECRKLGVLFALDDFGTGYSSLTYLKRLPVNQLKIDQSFVRDMLDDPEDLSILEGVLGLAIAFHREVIAEGVETTEHGMMLLQLGCDLAQGYGIERPMPASEFPACIAHWRTHPSWGNLPSVMHADLPLLFASAEHRAWVVSIESYIKGEREQPLSLNQHQCSFGKWLDSVSTTRHEMQPAIHAIEPLHRQLHELAIDLCALMASGRNHDALARLGELQETRDTLLKLLSELLAH